MCVGQMQTTPTISTHAHTPLAGHHRHRARLPPPHLAGECDALHYSQLPDLACIHVTPLKSVASVACPPRAPCRVQCAALPTPACVFPRLQPLSVTCPPLAPGRVVCCAPESTLVRTPHNLAFVSHLPTSVLLVLLCTHATHTWPFPTLLTQLAHRTTNKLPAAAAHAAAAAEHPHPHLHQGRRQRLPRRRQGGWICFIHFFWIVVNEPHANAHL